MYLADAILEFVDVLLFLGQLILQFRDAVGIGNHRRLQQGRHLLPEPADRRLAADWSGADNVSDAVPVRREMFQCDAYRSRLISFSDAGTKQVRIRFTFRR